MKIYGIDFTSRPSRRKPITCLECNFDVYSLKVEADPNLAEDPSGDRLDALLCAIQAAWAWTQREKGFGIPDSMDFPEGAIADPIGG